MNHCVVVVVAVAVISIVRKFYEHRAIFIGKRWLLCDKFRNWRIRHGWKKNFLRLYYIDCEWDWNGLIEIMIKVREMSNSFIIQTRTSRMNERTNNFPIVLNFISALFHFRHATNMKNIFQWIIGCHVIFLTSIERANEKTRREHSWDHDFSLLHLHWHNTDSHQLRMKKKNHRFFPFLIHQFDVRKSGVSFIKSSQTEWIMDDMEWKLQISNGCWRNKQNLIDFHSSKTTLKPIPSPVSIFFNSNRGWMCLHLYILMLLLCHSDCSISTCVHTPQNLIRFIQFASIKESLLTWFNDSLSTGVCSFSIFIVRHTSILIIHLFYGWHGAERTGAIRVRQWEMKSTINLFSCFITQPLNKNVFFFGNDKR